jgi:hypothetical protein
MTMTPTQPLQLLTARRQAAVAAAARRHAEQLRAEAQRDFFTAVGRALRRARAALHGSAAPARC